MLTAAESSLSIPHPETPLIHFFLPDCSVPALTRLICAASPAAHVCHCSDEAVTLRIYSPFSSFENVCLCDVTWPFWGFFPQFFRKDQHLLSPVNCWYLVLTQTRRESRDHATLNDIFMNNVIVRLSQISEDVIRLFKKVTWASILEFQSKIELS